jgi:DNA-binding NarL/FixJ family response regulator
LLKPKLVVLDIHMPVCNGLEAARVILLQFPRLLVLVLTMDGSTHFVLAAMACGAPGILVRSRAGEDLVGAASTLLRGERYFSSAHDPQSVAGG